MFLNSGLIFFYFVCLPRYGCCQTSLYLLCWWKFSTPAKSHTITADTDLLRYMWCKTQPRSPASFKSLDAEATDSKPSIVDAMPSWWTHLVELTLTFHGHCLVAFSKSFHVPVGRREIQLPQLFLSAAACRFVVTYMYPCLQWIFNQRELKAECGVMKPCRHIKTSSSLAVSCRMDRTMVGSPIQCFLGLLVSPPHTDF